MSYSILARKWRPQNFDDVLGQDAIIRTLKNSIENKRIHHSYIFAGLRGTGKTSTARILAKALNCTSGPTITPCQTCTQCSEIMAGNDIDVFEIDAASNKGVDDIRNLKEIVKYPPTRDRYKVFIIDEVHMLSTHAFNALLKTIEEPPSYVIFILATTEAHKIPTTIRSRCQIFDFRKIHSQTIAVQLKKICESEAIQITDQAQDLIIEASEGSMRDAESLLDQVISFSGNDIDEDNVSTVLGIANSTVLFELLGYIVSDNAEGVIKIMDELEGKNTDFIKFVARFSDFLKNTLHALIKKDFDFFPERFKDLKLSMEDILRFQNVILTQERGLRDAVNLRISVEMMLFKMVFSSHVVPISDLISKKKTENLELVSSSDNPEPVRFDEKSSEPSNSHFEEDVSISEWLRSELYKRLDIQPFMRYSEIQEKDNVITVYFRQHISSVILKRLEDMGPEIVNSIQLETGHSVTLNFSVLPEGPVISDRERLQEHPLVKEVMDTFDGEIAKINKIKR